MKQILGFSKLNKEEKIDWLTQNYFKDKEKATQVLQNYWNPDENLQKLHDEFTENTISNYYLPFGIAPNFNINGEIYAIPMAIEESSVIAAASNAAKFWGDKGGFKAEVIDTRKVGQVHFLFTESFSRLEKFFCKTKPLLLERLQPLTKNMEKRGGGILSLELRDKTSALANYYQIHVEFETLDAMGANFINSCLEEIALNLRQEAATYFNFSNTQQPLEVIMSILSNYVPNCLAKAEVSCPVKDLLPTNAEAEHFARKFVEAVNIAKVEPYRAVTHNKGIMNGIDAVVLATGNDFRAVEAGIHAYAAKNGQYSSLTSARVVDGQFIFSIEVPLALGTVGGLTNLHPLVKLAMEMLGNPTAKELMKIVAVAGLAQNFAAIKSLVTTGIQEGHMKMHLMNILNQFNATPSEKETVKAHFKTHTVTHSAVVEVLEQLRNA
ncbi:hydroxymethylglutaryl-CoA reductase, degradative [Mesonia ostreae]|uniref:3-hydroxy-3-methylglutaryl coenzyme A reductase n=1 Tax=Mesonia ostreae TaxID=861110 RepID=A0ABU2KHK8_9FLAO|nr:hydroxymethylglutaryl-CoA reductase, degradative [Mesonia ostreae]MDT0294169.1 hydroxymethylglutaryl-CoA reductase, degradative [Mesonia ostreae]